MSQNFDESKHRRGPDGKFASKGPSGEGEATLVAPSFVSAEEYRDASPEQRAEMMRRLAGALPEQTDVYYVDYDERLNDDQVDAVLSGNEMAAYNDYIDNCLADYGIEQQEAAAKYEMDNLRSSGVTDLAYDDLDPEDQDEFRAEVCDRDHSDPISDRSRNTPPQLMRANLGKPYDLVSDNEDVSYGQLTFERPDSADSQRNFDRRAEAISTILSKHGIDTTSEHNQSAIRELVENGPYDWHESVDVDVIWHGPVQTAKAEGTEGTRTSLTFTDPHVVLIDRANGEGHDVRLSGQMAKTFPKMPDEEGLGKRQRAFLDSDRSHGYGWNDIAGVHAPAYSTQVERNVSRAGDANHHVLVNGNRVDVVDGDVGAAILAARAKPTGSQPNRGDGFPHPA